MVTGRTDMGFQNPYVSKMTFELNDGFSGEFDGELGLGLSLNAEQVDENEKENVYLSTMSITLGKRSKEYPFFIETKISAYFFLAKESEMDEHTFVNHSTSAILYSYARPIISDMISKSGFPPFNLPFMNFTEMDLNYNEDNED